MRRPGRRLPDTPLASCADWATRVSEPVEKMTTSGTDPFMTVTAGGQLVGYGNQLYSLLDD